MQRKKCNLILHLKKWFWYFHLYWILFIFICFRTKLFERINEASYTDVLGETIKTIFFTHSFTIKWTQHHTRDDSFKKRDRKKTLIGFIFGRRKHLIQNYIRILLKTKKLNFCKRFFKEKKNDENHAFPLLLSPS